ncbi:Threonyl-tRNA synthetase [Mycobacteroides abscessus subsp. massiliense]|nr:Threonyl-tRNA synthetase [Mycobacteroides abscessus subsp. massiliense]
MSFRFRDRTQVNGVPRDEAVAAIIDWVNRHENVSPTAELMKLGTRD